MIEMQWVKVDFGNGGITTEQLKKYANVGGYPCVLQFREVFKDLYSKFETATEWQDVKIGEST
jgi:hypothetical protein